MFSICSYLHYSQNCPGVRLMVFKTSKGQLARRDGLAGDLRKRAEELNGAIADYNLKLDPFVRAVVEAQARYNDVLESARTLAAKSRIRLKSNSMPSRRGGRIAIKASGCEPG